MSGTDRLQDFRLRRGITQEEVAEELVRLAAADGLEVKVDASVISKWERGKKRPRRHYRRLLCRFYQATEEDLGFKAPKADGAYVNSRQAISGEPAVRTQCLNARDISQLTTSEAIVTLQSVTASDIASRRDALATMTAISGSLLLRPIMQLVGTISPATTIMTGQSQPHQVGLTEVADLEEKIMEFSKWGSQNGTHMRKAVIGQVRAVGELLEETPPGAIKTRLFEVAAQMAQQAGLMSYDCRLYGLAQRYYSLALHFCREAGNHLIAAKVIGDMSCIAIAMGKHQDALKFLSFAISCLPTRRQGLVQAELFGVFAATQARVGNSLDAHRAIEASMDASRNATNDPMLPVFNSLNLAAIHRWIATTYLNMARRDGSRDSASGYTAQAEQHVLVTLEGRKVPYFRGRALDTIRLMNVRLLQGEPGEAVNLGHSVMNFACGIRSSRIVDRLVQFHREVQDHYPSMPEIEEFRDRLRAYLIRSGETDVFAIA
ncbi:MAG TPA: helix-turn-helix transcriptional regulator [Candidatus Baltobacteraceae bacterium]|jgi:transcriptional regulator with XRE-family HTH domain|nr:helix-turn-helix transcriptional regulator [Candidatus Baltobacteraceae bacterium]